MGGLGFVSDIGKKATDFYKDFSGQTAAEERQKQRDAALKKKKAYDTLLSPFTTQMVSAYRPGGDMADALRFDYNRAVLDKLDQLRQKTIPMARATGGMGYGSAKANTDLAKRTEILGLTGANTAASTAADTKLLGMFGALQGLRASDLAPVTDPYAGYRSLVTAGGGGMAAGSSSGKNTMYDEGGNIIRVRPSPYSGDYSSSSGPAVLMT